MIPKTVLPLFVAGAALSFAAHVSAANVTKADGTAPLNTAAAWVLGAPPTSADVAVWDNTVTAAYTLDLGATTNWNGIQILDPGGAVTITNVNTTLFLGASGVNTSSGSQPLTLACPVALATNSANSIWNLTANVTLSGGLNGTNILELTGGGTLLLATATVVPTVQVDSGIAQLNTGSAGTIALNGGTVNINVAAGNPINVMANGGTEQNVGGNRTWSGALSGSGPLTVNASSIHTWSGNNSAYTGTITESGSGSLRLSSVNAVSATTAYNVGGTMNGNATGIFSLGSLTGSGTLGIAGGTPTWSVGGLNANADFGGNISGSGAILVKTGTGTQILSGANAYTGITVVSNGVLQIGDGGSAGSIVSAVVFVTNATSTLSFNRGDSSFNFTNLIVGIGQVRQDGGGTTFLSGPAGGTGANSYSGGTVLNGGTLKIAAGALGTGGIAFTNGATLQWAVGNTADVSSQPVTLGSGGGTLDVNGNTVTLADPIGNAGPGALTVVSTVANGTLNLSAANNYSGGTTANSGILSVNNPSGSGTGSGSVNIGGTATLAGNGIISGAVEIHSGGTIAPGNGGVGTNTVASLQLDSASIFNVEFSGSANDEEVVTTSGGLTINGGVVNLYQAGGTVPFTTPGTYRLIQYSGSIGGSGPGGFSIGNPQSGYSYAFGASGGFVTVQITASGINIGTWGVDANGNWSAAGNWTATAGTMPPRNARDSATLGIGSALRTVTLDANESIGSLTLSNGNSFVIANGGKTLTLDGSGVGASVTVSGGTANALQTAVALNDNVSINILADKSLSVSGVIANSGGAKSLTVAGSGTLALSGNNTYGPSAGSPGTTLLGATLQVGNNNALGAGDVNVSGSSTLQAGAAGLNVANNFSLGSGVTATVDNNGNNLTLSGGISGSGGLTKAGVGTLTLSGNNSYSGGTVLNAGGLSLSAAGNLSGNINFNGGLLLGSASFEWDGSHNLTIGAASGTVGTNAYIDAAGGQNFQIDGIIASAGNSGANNLIVNSAPGDNGTVILSGGNTFNGTTTISNGTLQVMNGSALQDSTLNYSSGTLAFNGGISTATLGGLTGTNNLSLTNLSGGSVTLTVGNNNADSTYAGGLIDNGVGGGLTKLGAGAFTLSGTNNYAGATTLAGATLMITNGGQIVSGGTVTINGGVNGLLDVAGGVLSAGGLVINNNNPGFTQTAGTSSFTNNVGFAQDNANNNTALQILGGVFKANSLTSGRTALNLSAQPAAGQGQGGSGIFVSNAVVTITNTLGVGGRTSGANSSTSMRMDSGTLNVGGTTTITINNGGRWSVLDINGGTFTSTDTNAGVQIGGGYGGANGLFLVRAGTVSVNQITFGDLSTQTSGSNILSLTGGTLAIGAGGLIITNPAPTFAVAITMSGGTVAASADWASAIPIILVTNVTTFQAADLANAPHNITLNGGLSGAGGLTKTGGGTVMLSGANTYTGNTVVNAGTLELALPTLASNSTVAVASSATLKLDFAGTDTVAALILNGVSKPAGVYNHSTDPSFLAGPGNIQVVPLVKPVPHITGISLSGITLTITATNGALSGQYVLWQSTNVALPLSQWTPVLTNVFDAGGNLNLSTNIINPGNVDEFYILAQ